MNQRPYLVLSFLVILGSIILSVVLYPPGLPERMPTHWNLEGKADSYGSRLEGAFLLPAINLGILGLLAALNWLSPRKFKLDTFRRTWEFITFLVIALLTYLHVVFLLAARGELTDINRAVMAGLFLFIGLTGNVLGKVRRNFWIGIRTPWTLASERVWNDTHRMAARIFVIAGILGFVAAMIGVHPFVSIGILVTAALISVFYSLFEYKRLERLNQLS